MKKEDAIVIAKVTAAIIGGVTVAAVATAACKKVPIEGLTRLNNPVFNKVVHTIGTTIIAGVAMNVGGDYAANYVEGVIETAITIKDRIIKSFDPNKIETNQIDTNL